MYTHVVLFHLNDPQDAAEAVARLEAMVGRIPALRALEAGVDDAPSDRSAHVCLITRFDDADGLEAYRVHPVHQELLAWMKPRVARSIKVDFAGEP
ncbi:MAG: Dabb family protein [Myxococcota bacterium]